MITFSDNFYLNHRKGDIAINKLFEKTNIIILVLGIVTLIVGYICLSRGPTENPLSLTVAPILLVLAYCVIIPLAIVKKSKTDNDKQGD